MKLSKRKFLHFLIFMIMVTTFLPIVYHNLPFPFRSFKFLWGPLWLVSFIVFNPSLLAKKIISFFLLYVLFLVFIFPNIIWHSMGSWYLNTNIYEETYNYSVGLTVFVYLHSMRDFKFWAKISQYVLLFFGITAVMTLISAQIDPMYARYMAGGAGYDANSIQGQVMYKLGGAFYSYGQAMSFILPVLIYYFKNNSLVPFSKITVLLFIVLLLIAIIRMQFFANIIISSLAVIISIYGSRRIKASMSVLLLYFVLFIIIPDDVIADFLIYLSSMFDSDSQNHIKLVDLAQFISSGAEVNENTGIGSRSARYPELIEAFLHRPLFGNFSSYNPFDINSAFHLYLGAKLAALGLVIFSLFIRLHYMFIKMSFRLFGKSNYAFYYAISIVVFILLSLMKQITGREVWFTYFIILPGLYYLPKLKEKTL